MPTAPQRRRRLSAACALVEAGATLEGIRGGIWTDSTRTRFIGGVLHGAVWRGHTALVQFLVGEAGADVNARAWYPWTGSFEGWTPLQCAASAGQAEAAAILLQSGADPDEGSGSRGTALYFATSAGHEVLARTLLGVSADPSAADAAGWTPLHLAARDNRRDLVLGLLNAEVSPDAATEQGWTPLALALALSFAVMFVSGYARTDAWDNVYLNLNRLYMTGLMVAPMALIMLGVMRSMFKHKGMNAAVAIRRSGRSAR